MNESVRTIHEDTSMTLEEVSQLTAGEILQNGPAICVGGVPMCHSVKLAHDLGIQHKNMLALIRRHIATLQTGELTFQPCTYKDPKGRNLVAYLLDKDAFIFVTLSRRGHQADQFRLKYISMFNHLQRTFQRAVDLDPDEERLIMLRDAAEFALSEHRKAKALALQVETLTTQMDSIYDELHEMRKLYEGPKGGAYLPLNASVNLDKEHWHGGPFFVDELRKKGLMSTDDIPRRKPQFFQNPSTGKLANHSDIILFIRSQLHIGRSTHENPMLRMEVIRDRLAGVFLVRCPSRKDDYGNMKEVHRPMVFVTPSGVEELVRRWRKRSTSTLSSLV